MPIKVEKWKNKRIVVSRNERGQIQSWIKYSSKNKINYYKEQFKSNGTFNNYLKVSYSNYKKYRLKQVTYATSTITDKPLIVLKHKKGNADAYYMELKLKNGKTIYVKTKKGGSRSRLYKNAYGILASKNGLGYDETEGKKLFDQDVVVIREGKLYYQRI